MVDDLNKLILQETEDISQCDETKIISEKVDTLNITEQPPAVVHSELPNYIKPLKSGMPRFAFTEFGVHNYAFEEVLGLDGKKTKNFIVYYTGPSRKDWGEKAESDYSVSGLLSDEYTVVKTEPLTKILAEEYHVNSVNIKSSLPFHLDCILDTSKNVNVFDDDASKLIFKMLSGLDSVSLDSVKTNVHIMINNSYNGTRSLTVKLILNTIGSINNVFYNFRDYFNLGRRSYTLEHFTSNIKLITSEVANTQNYIDSDFAILKECRGDLKDPLNKISSFLKKEQKINLESKWEMVPNDFKSLFMLLNIASMCIDVDYNIHQHQKLSVYTKKLIDKVIIG